MLWAVFSGFVEAFIITITWEYVTVSRSLQGRFNSAHFSAGQSFFFNELRAVQALSTLNPYSTLPRDYNHNSMFLFWNGSNRKQPQVPLAGVAIMNFLCFLVDSVQFFIIMDTTYVILHFLYLNMNCSATIEVLLTILRTNGS